jgi:cell wall-associated NlpC family hydrolase
VPTLSAAQVAALVKQVGFPESVHVTMVAIARAESGFRVEVVGGPNSNGSYDRGLWQINDIHGLDRNRLVTDATYNAQSAKSIYDSQGLGAWSVYNSGAYQQFVDEARQGVAQAAPATGSVVTPGTDAAAQPGGSSVTYGGPGPQLTSAGVGQPMAANAPREGGIGEVKILGATLEGDIGSAIIGEPKWSAGVTTVPNLQLTAIDEDYELLARGLWRIGSRIQWSDLDLRIDTHTMSPGGHGTGQAELGCVDDIVYALMSLTGPRTASGISATEWIAQELEEAGIDPSRYFLGESVPTQSEIARDVDDQSGQAGEGQKASAWTTAVRLAKELGKYIFVSGRRLVFGSAAFAMQWTAEGPLKLGYHVDNESEKFVSYPTTTVQSISSRNGTVQVTGRVPHNRAPYFRPGVPVDLTAVPGAVFGGDTLRMMVWKIDHTLVNDVDGAEITLVEPVDPPPEPPQSQTAAGVNGSPTGSDATGSGYSSQAGQVVALCLQQVGKQYIYGAEASASEPNPRAFDCSELIEWACARIGVSPTFPDGTDGQEAHCRNNGTIISVADAVNLKGALLFQPGHVALSLGDGSTVEAMNSARGVTKGNANGRGFTVGARIPGCSY